MQASIFRLFNVEGDSADMIAQNGWDPRRKAIVDREYDRQRAEDARVSAIMNCSDPRCVTCCFIYGIRDFHTVDQNGWDPRRKVIVDREYDLQRAGDARTTAIMNCRDLRCVTCCFIYGIRDFGLTSHHDLRRLNIARDAWRKAAAKVWQAEFLRYPLCARRI